ncbi:hypothetical protein DV736_g5915, partial [Chaetothyriales sp. CBS 134916]
MGSATREQHWPPALFAADWPITAWARLSMPVAVAATIAGPFVPRLRFVSLATLPVPPQAVAQFTAEHYRGGGGRNAPGPTMLAAATVQMGTRSRSNSDSSSLATVKRSTSLSSRSNPRTALLRPRGSSPQSVSRDSDRLPPNSPSSRRRGSSEEGRALFNRNINRWSHSTSSSVSAIDTESIRRRLQQSARRLSSNAGLSPKLAAKNSAPAQASRDPSQHRLPRVDAPRHHSQPASRLGIGPFYQQRGRSPNGSSTSLTPTSVYNTTTADYFTEPWQAHRQSSKLGEPIAAMSIQYTAPPQPKGRRRELSRDLAREISRNNPTQKSMLSKALSVANNAVLLDNAQNIDGAIAAYAEACDLLQQVMLRSSDNDDRKKLSAIRSTYSNRIAELHDLDDSFATLINKELPEDPPVDELNGVFFGSLAESSAADMLERVQIPPRQQSLLPPAISLERHPHDPVDRWRPTLDGDSRLNVTVDGGNPLAARSPRTPLSAGPSPAETVRPLARRPEMATAHHVREESSESTSWLDTIDDAESSQSSSRLSPLSVDHGQNAYEMMDEIEADFDAAVNAAVIAAYESDRDTEETPKPGERYADVGPSEGVGPSFGRGASMGHGRQEVDDSMRDYLDDETTEEEERILDEMSQDFAFDDFHFDTSAHSALPRQSDSSTFSNKTFSSSVPSMSLTTGTSLSALAGTLEPPKPPPTKAVPPTPNSQPDQYASYFKLDRLGGVNLRDRRLSGQIAGQLKIETYAPARGTWQPALKNGPLMPKLDIPAAALHTGPAAPPANGLPYSTVAATQQGAPIAPITALRSSGSQTADSPATAGLGRFESFEETGATSPSPSSRAAKMLPPPTPVRKTVSSSSLRLRTVSINEEAGLSPGSAQFPADAKKSVPPMPTATPTVYAHQATQSGGIYLFEDHVGIPTTPTIAKAPRSLDASSLPVPLEPCPDSYLLRPWWLMRCLYGAISHPRGGYISNKVFLPRHIWRVRNVKLKMVDDKIAQCDVLTAALLKLAKVNEFDADAVLEELQSFETVLDHVRAVLQKKLGNDVGLSGSTNAFRSPADEADGKAGSASASKNTFASSWRKLRSKSSNAASTQHSAWASRNETANGGAFTMASLPMTTSSSVPTSRSYTRRNNLPPPPTPTGLNNINHISGPHATYMASLTRLFEAVHVLDTIARQVEDPGLKCSSQTQVGLELGVRTAAEFFAFYVLRFVMTDIGILLDKYLKRGTEWVLA